MRERRRRESGNCLQVFSIRKVYIHIYQSGFRKVILSGKNLIPVAVGSEDEKWIDGMERVVSLRVVIDVEL